MKTKVLFTVALFMGVSSLVAQNLVKNGNFEALEYVDELDGTTHKVYTWNRGNYGYLTVFVPGWDRRLKENSTDLQPMNYEYEAAITAGEENPEAYDNYNVPGNAKWNGYSGLVEQVDAPVYDKDSWYYLNIRRYQDDGWGAKAGLSQTIDVEPGQKYHLSFVYSLPVLVDIRGGLESHRAPVGRRIEVINYTDNTVLYEFAIDDLASAVEWTVVESEFETGETNKVVLTVSLTGNWDDDDTAGGQNKGTEISVDNFAIWKDGTELNSVAKVLSEKIMVNAQNGVIRIQGVEAGDRLSVYNMAGQEVVNSTVSSADFAVDAQLAAGIYVVKINDAIRKVVL